ncbi:MAG: ABC transporter ATP-binding protein [Halanaerobiales bacterium]|nr:ABC transporter ATP-binding protein [Halanaerobiales bacterium]
MEDVILRTENLRKVYTGNVIANNNLSINIKKGEIFGLLGPNGAGKTTFIRQIAGLISPTSGEIYFEEINVVDNPNIIPNYISYFGQQIMILDSHRAWESVYYTGIFRGLSKFEAMKQTNLLLGLFKLDKQRNKLMSKLSGGQKKIVGIIFKRGI